MAGQRIWASSGLGGLCVRNGSIFYKRFKEKWPIPATWPEQRIWASCGSGGLCVSEMAPFLINTFMGIDRFPGPLDGFRTSPECASLDAKMCVGTDGKTGW